MKKGISGIYKMVSPSGKVYIGQSVDIRQRKYVYGNSFHSEGQYKLHRSFLKYGYINHNFEIIEECEPDDLNCRERHWQDFYDVLDKDKGLNLILTECGEKRRIISEEHREKLSKIGIISAKNRCKKVYQYNLEGKLLNIYESAREASEKTGFTIGSIKTAKAKKIPKLSEFLWSTKDIKVFSEELLKEAKLTFADKMRTKEFYNDKKTPILQYDLDNNFIKEWRGMSDASKLLNIKANNIWACCKNKKNHHTAGGYKWKYKLEKVNN